MRPLHLIVPLLLGPCCVSADILLCTGGDIRGSVSEQTYAGCIALTSYQAGISSEQATQVGGGVRGPAQFTDIVLSKGFDRATLGLRRAAIQRQVFAQWSIHFVNPGCGDQRLEYQRINLSDVTVSAANESGTAENEYAEVLSLSFSQVEYIQTEYDETCREVETSSFAWDLNTDSSP